MVTATVTVLTTILPYLSGNVSPQSSGRKSIPNSDLLLKHTSTILSRAMAISRAALAPKASTTSTNSQPYLDRSDETYDAISPAYTDE